MFPDTLFEPKVINSVTYSANLYVMKKMKFCDYNTCSFIFFVTNKWAQKARMLQYTRLERLPVDKHSSLLGSLVSYEENETLPMWSLMFWAGIHLYDNEITSLIDIYFLRIIIIHQTF